MARTLGEVFDRIAADPFWDGLRETGSRLVPGIGATEMAMAFLSGEAPGATENTHGRPFCGASGRVLDGLMEAAGLHIKAQPYGDADFSDTAGPNTYLTNVVKYRPPGNRTPTLAEVSHGAADLRKEYQAVGSPKLIVTIGTTARTAILIRHPDGLSLGGRLPMGKPWYLGGPQDAWLVPMYHPAFGLRQPNMRPVMERHWEELGRWIHEIGIF